MAEISHLYSQGTLQPPRFRVCPLAKVEQTLREITPEEVIVISYEDREQEVEVASHRFLRSDQILTIFSSVACPLVPNSTQRLPTSLLGASEVSVEVLLIGWHKEGLKT